MSTHAYVRPLGVWNPNQVVTHAEFAALDFGQFDSISASGGTYALAALLTIGGAGVFFSTRVTVGTSNSDSFTVNASTLHNGFFGVALSGAFQIECAALFDGSVTIGTSNSDNLAVNASALFHGFFGVLASGAFQIECAALFDGSVTLGNASADVLTVKATATFAAAATFNAAVAFNDSIACTDTLGIAGGALVTTPMTCSGAGRILRPAQIGAASGGGTADPAVATVWWFQAGMASQFYALGTGSDGDELEFSMAPQSSANTLTITGGALGSVVMTSNGSGALYHTRWKHIIGNWQLLSHSVIP